VNRTAKERAIERVAEARLLLQAVEVEEGRRLTPDETLALALLNQVQGLLGKASRLTTRQSARIGG
jgi:hypothetical protein